MKKVLAMFLAVGLLLSIVTLNGCTSKDEYLPVSNDSKHSEVVAKLDSFMNEFSDKYSFSGSVLIAKEGNILLNKGYLMADYENKILNTPHTVFSIGSITKQFTAMGIMMLQEKGLLNVNDTLNKYLPDFPNGDRIKIHNLLTHTSGIKDYYPNETQNLETKRYTVTELIDLFKNKLLNFEPGEKFQYSNSNYVLLGYIIEKVSGVKYEDFIAENIFKPLEMNSSGFDLQEASEKNRAVGYTKILKNKNTDNSTSFSTSKAVPLEPTIFYAMAGLCTTSEDLYKWDQALYTEKLVKQETLKKIFTPFMDDYGYGWFTGELGGDKVASHAGNVYGFSSYIARNMSNNYVIIILSNRESLDLDKLASGLYEILDPKINRLSK